MRSRTALIIAMLALSLSFMSYADDSVPGLVHNPFNQPDLISQQTASEDENATPEWSDSLQAVLVAGQDSLANIDGDLLGIGDMYEGFRLVRVDVDTATFSKGEKEVVVRIGSENDEDDE